MGLRVAVIGGGWGGLAAAVQATAEGHQVSLLEASRQLGGRARSLPLHRSDQEERLLDWGQHVLLESYHCTFSLMRQLGVSPDEVLQRTSLPTSTGKPALRLPRWPSPWNLWWGVLTGRLGQRRQMLSVLSQWQRQGFECSASATVQALCSAVPEVWMAQFIRPLCLLLLNAPPERAHGQVFLSMLRDALNGSRTGMDLLLPRVPLQSLLPDAARQWLQEHQATVHTGHRVRRLIRGMEDWQVDGQPFDHVVLACPSREAIRLVQGAMHGVGPNLRQRLQHWAGTAERMAPQAMATVQVLAPGVRLDQPLLRLTDTPLAPAQFVIDRGQLGGAPGWLAFRVGHCLHDRETVTRLVLQQAQEQLGLTDLQVRQTLVDRRAGFACHAGLLRPSPTVAKGLGAAGDYVEGPWPASLEGAVRSGMLAALSVDGVKPPAPWTAGGPDAPGTASARTLSWDDVPSILPPAESS